MTDVEDVASKHGYGIAHTELNVALQEYDEIVADLRRDLHVCKTEQNDIRIEIEILQKENQNANEIARGSFSRVHAEERDWKDLCEREAIANLQERIAIVQTEKDSIYQLWQISLKAIDALEEEFKIIRSNGKGSQFYEEVNGVRETYSEAIKALEAKLLQARENFIKYQSLWESSKERVENLSKEKENVMQRLRDFQKEAMEKDRNNQQTMGAIRAELSTAKAEVRRIASLKSELEVKLNEAKVFAKKILEKDVETKSKMSEAIELIESAVREKDLALHRQMLILEEKNKLEIRMTAITDEYTSRLEEETKKMAVAHETKVKAYVHEIKELKAELREKVTLLDRAQRECRSAEEELEKFRKNAEILIDRSNEKVMNFEHKLKGAQHQLHVCDEVYNRKHDHEVKRLQDKITELEIKIVSLNNTLKEMQQQESTVPPRDHIKAADERTKDALERCTDLETQLTQTLNDRENLMAELKSLQSVFHREIHKADDQRHLENRIRLLEEDLRKTLRGTEQLSLDFRHVGSQETSNKYHCCQSALSRQLCKLQEKFDERTKELSRHVEVHQRLSKKWRDESKCLAKNFQKKFHELQTRISVLKKENNELNNELLSCRQQLARYRAEIINRQDREVR